MWIKLLGKDLEDLCMRMIALNVAEKLSKGDNDYILKHCSCGRKYHIAEWFDLPFVGYQKSEFMDGEFRECQCSSTLFFVTERKF